MRFPRPLLILGLIMTTTAAPADDRRLDTPSDTLSSGASLLWTSDDPLIVSARAMILRGELAKASQLLDSTPDGAPTAVAEVRDVIARIRHDYSLEESALLSKLGRSVREVSASDITNWTRGGQIQFRDIDAQRRYFRREPSNLFRFCPEAISRRINPPAQSNEFLLNDHLADVIAEARRTHSPHVAPIRHRVKLAVTVPKIVKGYKPGATIKAWLPYPQEYGSRQTDVKLISSIPANPQIAPNGSIHRSLYYQQQVKDPSKPIRFEAVFEFTSRAEYRQLEDSKVQPLPPNFPVHYLAERPPHIRFSPELKQIVAEVTGKEINPLAKARKIFHWIDANIRYHAEEEYCIIPSFSEAALKRRRGDCGIQATLFVTMCRAAGVPARWQSGWQTKPARQHNMHDWAEIYVAPWGWLPCDPSYGLQKSDDPAIREFYFGHQDSYRLIVNLDYGGPLTPAKQSLRSEPADFQRGEVEIDGKNLYFDEFDCDFEVTHLDR